MADLCQFLMIFKLGALACSRHAPGFLILFLCVHMYVCVCVCVCVSTPEAINITSGMIWTPGDWLNKFYSRCMTIVVIIVNGGGLGIDTRHTH